MDPHELESTNHDPSRIFGEPYETGGVTIIPVARTGRNHEMRPLGVYAVRGDQVTWHAAVDHERLRRDFVLFQRALSLRGPLLGARP